MKNHFWIAMALLSLGVTSCKDDITFDQETYDQLVDAAFPVQNVDPTHQWATVGVANTIINVNTGTKDVYQVKIYEQNPIGYQGTLKLLGEGRITDGDALKMKISYQLAQPWAYVTLFDSQNYMSVYPALIKDGVLNVDVNNAKTPNASRRAGIEPKWKFSGMPADEDFATSLPDNYVTDANANGGGQGVNIVIQSSYIGYLNLWNAGSNTTLVSYTDSTAVMKGKITESSLFCSTTTPFSASVSVDGKMHTITRHIDSVWKPGYYIDGGHIWGSNGTYQVRYMGGEYGYQWFSDNPAWQVTGYIASTATVLEGPTNDPVNLIVSFYGPLGDPIIVQEQVY